MLLGGRPSTPRPPETASLSVTCLKGPSTEVLVMPRSARFGFTARVCRCLHVPLVTVVSLAVIGGSAAITRSSSANSLFGAKSDYATEGGSLGVVIGDLNRDGKPDLVLANTGLGTVSVLLGNGDGTFRTKRDFAAGGYPYAVAIGDLNGDGKLDVVVANGGGGPNVVSVLLGNGDGTFGAHADYGAGGYPQSVAIGDLNGDGKPDLVVANYNSNTISVLLGNGDGTFGAKRDFGTGANPERLSLGDLNGDGKLDVAVANWGSNTVSVLLGNGDGTFGTKMDLAAANNPFAPVIGDLNHDGKLDLVVGNDRTALVSVFLGNGDGTFAARQDYATGSHNFAAIGDLNGDGIPDLAVSSCDAGTVSVLLGNGDGTFGAHADYGAGGCPSAVAIGDLNGDGKPDLVVATQSPTVSVLMNTGDGPPSAPQLLEPPAGAVLSAAPTFAWQSIAGALRYVVLVATDPLLQHLVWAPIITAPSTSIHYSGPPLNQDVVYYWSVRALAGSSWTALAPPQWFKMIGGGPAVGQVSLMAPTSGSMVLLPETFSWQPASGAVGCRVWIAVDATFATPLWTSSVTTATSLTVPAGIVGVTLGGAYWWAVSAVGSSGSEGVRSKPFQFVIGQPSLPGAVTLLSPAPGAPIQGPNVTLTWLPADRATVYDVTYSLSPTFDNGSNTTWTLPGIASQQTTFSLGPSTQTVYWKVTPRNSSGSGPASAVSSFAYQYAGLQVAGATMLLPTGGESVGVNQPFSAIAQVTGGFSGTVTGAWFVDGASWQSFSATMTPLAGARIKSPPLPTSSNGTHTVQVVVSSPSVVASGVVNYSVVPVTPGSPVRLMVSIAPQHVVADGVSQASVVATELDAFGIVVTTDNGRSISASCTGPGAVLPAAGTISQATWATYFTAGSTQGQSTLTFTASGLAGAQAAVNSWPTLLETLRNEALQQAETLKHLTVDLPPGEALSLLPSYSMDDVEDFISTSTDTAALRRLALALKTVRRIYHFDPTVNCTEDCVGSVNPGAAKLVDDGLEGVQSLVAMVFAADFLEVKIEESIPLAKEILRWAVRDLRLAVDAGIDRGLRVVSDPNVREALKIAAGSVESMLDAETSGQAVLGLLTSPYVRLPADAVFLGSVYTRLQTQPHVDKALALAQQPITNAFADALQGTATALADATQTSTAADAKAQLAAKVADIADAASDILKYLTLVPAVSEISAVGAVIAKVTSGVSDLFEIGAALHGYLPLPGYTSDAVDGAFGSLGTPFEGASRLVVVAEPQDTARPDRALWTQLTSDQGASAGSFEALARQASNFVAAADTTGLQNLLPSLSAAADTLEQTEYLAESPVTSAAAAAATQVAGFDSLAAALDLDWLKAQTARVTYATALLQYLLTPADAVARLQALDAGSAAIEATNKAQSAQQALVATLFDAPAVPVLRMASCVQPDTVVVGAPFTIQTLWRNLGAGPATGGYVKLMADSAFSVTGADSVPLPTLAPGDSSRIVWSLTPMRAGAQDSFSVQPRHVQFVAGAASGIGEHVTLRLRVALTPTTGVGPGSHPLDQGIGLWLTPNPTHQGLTIRYALPAGTTGRIELLDITGRRVALVAEHLAGPRQDAIQWASGTSLGSSLSPGVYFVRLTSTRGTMTKHLVFMP